MKKIFTSVFLSLGVFSLGYAQANLFDAADVDADGWIWFDTQAKIDKYIGLADNENYKYDENGKLIQLVSANFGEYIDSEASADFIGAGTDKVLEGEGAKKGAIKLADASAAMSMDGGGFAVKMPSCTSFNIMLSSDGRVMCRMLGTTETGKLFGDYTVASAKYGSVFGNIAAGQFTWADIQSITAGVGATFKLESESTMYAYFQSLTKNSVFIHGLKVLKSGGSSIEETANAAEFSFDGQVVTLANEAQVSVYGLQGTTAKVATGTSVDLSDLTQGVYVVKAVAGNSTYSQKVVIK